MKVLLIQSYLGRKEQPILPLGLAYLVNNLDGYEISILDPNIADDPFDSIRKKLVSFKPEVIGISIRNIDTTLYRDMFYYYKYLGDTIELIKEVAPNSRLIIGGSAFSLYAEDIMLRNPKIDFGIYLEGEETLPELLNNLSNPSIVKGIYYRQNGKLLFTGVKQLLDFKNAMVPNRKLFELDSYKHPEGVGVQSKRGCVLNCAYCTYPFLTGHNIRLRSPKSVVDEIEELINQYGITYFMFADTVFNVPKWHAVEICEEIIRRDIKSKWSAYFSLKKMDEDFIKLAQRAGCYLFFFSPDGYSKESLSVLRKEVDKREIKNAYKLVKKLKGARFDFSFFINPPGQNYLSFLAIMWLLLKTNFILPRRKFMHISVNVIRLEPRTHLYNLALKEGVLSRATSLLPPDENNLSSLFYHNPHTKFIDDIFRLLLKIFNTLKNLRNNGTNSKNLYTGNREGT